MYYVTKTIALAGNTSRSVFTNIRDSEMFAEGET